jgi:hypothetical protein
MSGYKPETIDKACQHFREALTMMGQAPADSVNRNVHAFDLGTGNQPGHPLHGHIWSVMLVILPKAQIDALMAGVGQIVEAVIIESKRQPQ